LAGENLGEPADGDYPAVVWGKQKDRQRRGNRHSGHLLQRQEQLNPTRLVRGRRAGQKFSLGLYLKARRVVGPGELLAD
jgi:hypothetical protein